MYKIGFLSKSAAGGSFSQGPLFPSKAIQSVTGGGEDSWINLTNLFTYNNTYATCNYGTPSNLSYFLHVSQYGFTIPPTATITGVEVTLYGLSNNSAEIGYMSLYTSNQYPSGTSIGIEYPGFVLQSTNGEFVQGGPDKPWGAVFPTPAQANNLDFGLVINVQNGPSIPGGGAYASIDTISITLYYTL